MNRAARMASLLCGVAILVAACGSDGEDGNATDAADGGSDEAATLAEGGNAEAGGEDTGAPSRDAAVDVTFDPSGPLDPELVARAVVVLSSCRGGAGPLGQLAAGGDEPPELLLHAHALRFGRPVDDTVRQQLACLGLKSNGCAALEQCTGSTVDREPCTPRCDGDIAETCRGPRRVRTNCTVFGLACASNGGSSFGCVEPGAARCTSSFVGGCEGGRPTGCERGHVQHGPRCADFDLDCLPGGDGGTGESFAACRGRGPACTGGFSSSESVYLASYVVSARCDGPSTFVTCTGGHEARYDCTTVARGFSCHTTVTDRGSFAACGRGTACLPGEARDYAVCTGDTIQLCNGGIMSRFDCKALGFRTCEGERCVE